ncbi:glycoside hydrolase family 88 protein [Segatella maculosa]|uniref:glycoside hydrolase family 88 protein n=1 Tax=Segatella maculosa TaxID=439703 RepID=UPI0023F0196E|nr:glycoside hydrolase family 88 protein [Segatella maculosa]
MNKLSVLLLALFFPLLSLADGWNEAEYRTIERSIESPKIANRSVVITKFGAKTSASAAENQKAILRAIAVLAKQGGGKVIVPAGKWNTGALRLQSGIELVVSKDAHLQFVFDRDLYPLVKTSWEGMMCWNYSPCIYSYEANDVVVSGEGTIDGGGSNETWWPMNGKANFGYVKGVTKEAQVLGSRARLQKMAEADVPWDERRFGKGYGLRPQLINFVKGNRIRISGVTLLRSPFWVIHPLLCKNVTVDGVKIWNEGPNGDGCDPEGCENVLIQNTLFHTGDDCIAIKSGRNNDGRFWNQPSKNIIIRNCVMEDGHGGVVIGSEISGGCQNVYAEDCEMDSPELDRVLRIKTNNCRGGLIENINMRRVKVGQCKEAVVKINLDYEPKEPCYRGFEPVVRNVNVEDVTCQKSAYGVLIVGRDSVENVTDIRLKNCSFNGISKENVKITGKTRHVTFENVKMDGQLVLAPEDKPFKSMAQWMTFSEMKRTPQPYLLDFAPKPRWSYVMGIELEGMLDTYQAYGGDGILNYLKAYPRKMIDDSGEVTGYDYKAFNLDNVRTAKFILRMQQIDPRIGNDKALATMMKQLRHQPRTHEGVFWHKAIYANQVWLDGIFMGLPFYCAYAMGHYPAKKARRVLDDAVDQIVKTDKRTYDEASGLWKHAWDETRSQFWADPQTGRSKHTWARALGWYVMAMAECLDVMPDDYARKSELKALLQKAMKAVVRYQDKQSGVWYDVMDVKNPKNYLESTASCMFAYVLLKGARMGWLDESYAIAGRKAYDGILKRFIRVNDDRTISLTDCCVVSGLGPGKGKYVKPGKENYRRDGSFEYYMSEPIRDNDPKGIGPFLWASLEMERN